MAGAKIDTYRFLRSVTLVRELVPSFAAYPFSIPAIERLQTLKLHPKVTFLIGENGSGKSTLIEAIAVAAGFNAEGGSKNFRFATRASHSELYKSLRLARGIKRERDGFFLRAESYFNLATNIEELDREGGGPSIMAAYSDVSLHEQSHGESFLALATRRLRGNGLYIFDEPEAALSPTRQLTLLKVIDELVQKKSSQFVIATHSPILMAYPDSDIYSLSSKGIKAVRYEDTEHYQVTRDFLVNRERFFKHLFAPDGDDE
ncbi:MAG TPA: AAA family ATPase [Polyangia bacterium]|nr:AAA family ATPase [Polyangia bacterium]